MAGEARVLTPEQEAILEERAKEQAEKLEIEKGKRGELGVAAPHFAEIVAHPEFNRLKKVAGGFNAATAPNIVAGVFEVIQGEENRKKAEAAARAKAEEEERARMNGGGNGEVHAGGGGTGDGSDKDKDPDPRTLDLSHLPVCVRGKLIKEWDARNGSRK